MQPLPCSLCFIRDHVTVSVENGTEKFQSNSSVNSCINELYVWEKCSSPSELFLPCDLLSRPLPLHSPAMNHDSTSQTNHFLFKQYRSRERERERRSGITVIKLMLASCSSCDCLRSTALYCLKIKLQTGDIMTNDFMTNGPFVLAALSGRGYQICRCTSLTPTEIVPKEDQQWLASVLKPSELPRSRLPT